jgi:flagellar biosynthesis/type III secretory pathway protein FliH
MQELGILDECVEAYLEGYKKGFKEGFIEGFREGRAIAAKGLDDRIFLERGEP